VLHISAINEDNVNMFESRRLQIKCNKRWDGEVAENLKKMLKTFGPKNGPQKLKFIHFQPIFTKFNMDTQNEIYDDFPELLVWDWILEHINTLTLMNHIYKNIVNQALNSFPRCS